MKENRDLPEAMLNELLELIELGFTNGEIQQYFPELSLGSIIAYRAHLTRGTYDGGVHDG